jgi:ribosome biogenesis GTPase A
MNSDINWFPGHMLAALDKAAKGMANIDVVVEVLDARSPAASMNPNLVQLRAFHQRPALKVLNKADLADPKVTALWLKHFQSLPKTHAVAISARKPGDGSTVVQAAQRLAPFRTNLLKPLRLMMMGVPNVGKSTLINTLLKKKVAKVGDMPAVTKTLQRYIVHDALMLTDTPGVMWPKILYPSDGMMLAAGHMVGTNAYYDTEVAAFLGAALLARYPEALMARYKFAELPYDGPDVIEAIAKRRGLLLKGKGYDLEKAAMALLNDYRLGTLGRLSLETPASRAEMMATTIALEAEIPPETEL